MSFCFSCKSAGGTTSKHWMPWLFLITKRPHFQIIYFIQKVWFGFSRSVQYHRAAFREKKKVPYLWQSEDSPSSSIWTGRLSSHHHHTPPRCCLSLNPARARSSHCYCSFLHCVPRWTHWGTAGSSCRRVGGRARGSAGLREESGRAAHRAAVPGGAVWALIPTLLSASLDASWHHRGPLRRLPLWQLSCSQLQLLAADFY